MDSSLPGFSVYGISQAKILEWIVISFSKNKIKLKKKKRIHLPMQETWVQSWLAKLCFFSISLVRMWELDHKEGWVLKNWCFWIVVLEKTLEIPWDSKEIKPVNLKVNQPWIFIGSTDAEAPIFGHLMQRIDSLEKTLMLGEIEN